MLNSEFQKASADKFLRAIDNKKIEEKIQQKMKEGRFDPKYDIAQLVQ